MRKSDAMETLRRNIRIMLTARGWSQSHLAALTGIARPNLNRIINSDVSVSVDTAETIAKAFELTLAEMLSENLERILSVPA